LLLSTSNSTSKSSLYLDRVTTTTGSIGDGAKMYVDSIRWDPATSV
jgi:hypothetical protein